MTMSLTRLDLRGRRLGLAEALPGPASPGADVRDAVASVLAQVRNEGDAALLALTSRWDGAKLESLRVPADEITTAANRISPELRDALQLAYRRIVEYHAWEAGLSAGSADPIANGQGSSVFRSDGVTVRNLVRPVERVGCYAPGGRARYPSSVLMCAAPARVAGVAKVVLCVPPRPDGTVDDATLAAAAVAGIEEIHPVGGAQAIAALAYGTESIPPVDIIVGPGNRYVAEAKRQVSGQVGVASAFAGPSEVVVVTGPSTPPTLAAVDLMVQAEHGPDGLAWLVTWDQDVLDAVDKELSAMVMASPRRADLEATLASGGYACLVDDVQMAVEVANIVAPEHLELLVDGAEELLPLVRAAGAVFCGPWSPASIGDYLAGPNHVLPTNRTARFGSALRADDFRRHIHAVSVSHDGLRALAPHLTALALTEGLPAHAESVRLRG